MIKGSLADDLGKAKRYLPQYMRNLTDATSKDMRDKIKDFTHVDTGELKESVVTIDTDRRFTPGGIQVWSGGAKSDLDRASFSEYDTAPHIIRAKSSVGLRFFDNRLGVSVVREEVYHPGTTGVHMFARGSDAVDDVLKPRMESMIIRWAKRYGL